MRQLTLFTGTTREQRWVFCDPSAYSKLVFQLACVFFGVRWLCPQVLWTSQLKRPLEAFVSRGHAGRRGLGVAHFEDYTTPAYSTSRRASSR